MMEIMMMIVCVSKCLSRTDHLSVNDQINRDQNTGINFEWCGTALLHKII